MEDISEQVPGREALLRIGFLVAAVLAVVVFVGRGSQPERASALDATAEISASCRYIDVDSLEAFRTPKLDFQVRKWLELEEALRSGIELLEVASRSSLWWAESAESAKKVLEANADVTRTVADAIKKDPDIDQSELSDVVLAAFKRHISGRFDQGEVATTLEGLGSLGEIEECQDLASFYVDFVF